MKYKDKGFIKFQDKQRFDDMTLSERNHKRKLKLDNDKYYKSFLKNIFEKDWWDSHTEDDKSSIISSFKTQSMYQKEKDGNVWYNTRVFNELTKWREWALENWKPDLSVYRQLRMKKLGI